MISRTEEDQSIDVVQWQGECGMEEDAFNIEARISSSGLNGK